LKSKTFFFIKLSLIFLSRNGQKNNKEKKAEKRSKKNKKTIQPENSEKTGVVKIVEKHSRNNNSEKKQHAFDSSHSVNTRSSDEYSIKFRVFISPEFVLDPSNCEIGIFSNYNGWSERDMQKLEIVK